MHRADNWRCDCREDYQDNTDFKFKLQWCERSDKIATCVMIRTDKHPQSLLDPTSKATRGDCALWFEGSALDGDKCYQKSRWWDILYISAENKENAVDVTVAFKNRVYGLFLSDTLGPDPALEKFADNTLLTDLPERIKWRLRVVDHALSPKQVGLICATPFVAVAGALSGGAAAASIGAAIGIGAAAGAIGSASATVLNCLENVSAGFFVDW